MLGQVLDIPLLGDVRVEGHEALVGQGLPPQQDDLAVGAPPLGDVAGEAGGGRHPFRHQGFRVAGAILPALGVVADEAGERRPHVGHLPRKIQEAQEGFVPGHQAQVGVENGNALVEQVEAGLQHFETLAFVLK